jgi:type IV secretory pathway TraG/TraD family ATPase VirD4
MKLRRRRSAPVSSSQQFPAHIPGRPWFGLYCGDGPTGPTYCGTESSLLVLGPPRSGKTTSIVVPCVLDAPGAVVSTSTKPDVLAQTGFWRWMRGRCFLFDPSGTVAVPEGVAALRWSPVTGCEVFEKAVEMAHSLASAARPQAQVTESAHWIERAEALLAPMLLAAALKGRDMATVCRWVLGRDVREPEAVIAGAGHEMAGAVLAGVAATEDRERSGIFSTAAGILAAYRSEAALRSAADPNFIPEEFARSTDTVYVSSPAHAQEQLAPLVVALLDQIRSAVYARPANAAPVVFALDEVAGIAPLPSLPALAAEGGGQGLVTLAALQDLSQARARWGAAADGFFSLFSTKLLFPGIGDRRTLELVSALAGEVPIKVTSETRSGWEKSYTQSWTWRPLVPVDEVARVGPNLAVCVTGSRVDRRRVVPWTKHPQWSTYAGRRTAPVHSETLRPLGTGRRPTDR